MFELSIFHYVHYSILDRKSFARCTTISMKPSTSSSNASCPISSMTMGVGIETLGLPLFPPSAFRALFWTRSRNCRTMVGVTTRSFPPTIIWISVFGSSRTCWKSSASEAEGDDIECVCALANWSKPSSHPMPIDGHPNRSASLSVTNFGSPQHNCNPRFQKPGAL